MLEGGIFGLIKDLYPVSTIMIVLTGFGFFLSWLAYKPYIRFLQKQLSGDDEK